ncbi:MAG: hypothetical protein AB7I30_04450 [Isosphaeraceae bacterium]
MERSVTMRRKPEGLSFPEDFAGRIRYDEARQRLIYSGFMSKADFDRLCLLSDDWGYRRPLEELFRLCTPDAARPRLLSRVASVFFSF